MKTIKKELLETGFDKVSIGRQGENLATRIEFDISSFVAEFGNGTVTLMHQRVQDKAPYIVKSQPTSEEFTTLGWNVTSIDTAFAGRGRAEIIYTVGGAVVKSVIIITLCEESLESTVPDALSSWTEGMIAGVKDAFSQATEKVTETKVYAESAEHSANSAKTQADLAKEYADDAKASKGSIANSIKAAQDAAAEIENFRRAAGESAISAEDSAKAAAASMQTINETITAAQEARDDARAAANTLEGSLDRITALEEKTEDMALESTCQEILARIRNDEIFGFIEHNSILSPSTRIEYIDANKNYTPLAVDLDTGICSYGSWSDFAWLVANKPYMVHLDGTPDYQLNETDYSLKLDGTPSDVSNPDYEGGAYSWAKKIYKRVEMIGKDRKVEFCMRKLPGFEPVGFMLGEEETQGAWIPMFYSCPKEGTYKSLANGLFPVNDKTTDQQWAAIRALGDRHRLFGGSLLETLGDLMILFTKTTNIQEALGHGSMNSYNDKLETYGTQANLIDNPGQFYGTKTNRDINRIFHSMVLGTWNVYTRDPYTLLVNGRLKVSPDYSYDLSGKTYIDTGLDHTDSGKWLWPDEYVEIKGYGPLPTPSYKGSSATGGCDGIYVEPSGVRVGLRLGSCVRGGLCGPRGLALDNTAGGTWWAFGAADLLFPPDGAAV